MTRFEQGTGEYKNNRARYDSLFAQDDYKISQRVSLNLGVRWEPAPPWREEVGRFQQFRLADYQNNVRSTVVRQRAARPAVPRRPGRARTMARTSTGSNTRHPRRLCVGPDRRRQNQPPRRLAACSTTSSCDGEFYNVGVNSPPWSITTNITEPQGPFSDPYRGRTAADFNLVTRRPSGGGTPHSRRPC